jgi:hypothetical protein
MAAEDIADDTLRGVKQIANYLGEKQRRTFYLCENRLIPAYQIGGRWYLRRSTHRAFVERLEAKVLSAAAHG